MIQLTRLNNQPLLVNSDLIKFIERAPDTVLTLVSGEKVVVLESCEQVLEKVIGFRRTILSGVHVRVPEPPGGAETNASASCENPLK
jgi:flagellar protein FlbD